MELTESLLVILGLTGVGAGFLGAILGIGGGIIVVPSLVLVFGFDFKVAVACSLIAVVASSTASSSVYIAKGLTNMRLGMTLEVATTLGGIAGGLAAAWMSSEFLTGVFSFVMIALAVLMVRKKESAAPLALDPTSSPRKEMRDPLLRGAYFDESVQKQISYQVRNLPLGGAVSFFAGLLSGLLGVGGGFLKVPAMNLAMDVPLKVATATSNFMIGVTAISSLYVYMSKGYVYPVVAAPIAIGVVLGALAGTQVAQRISPRSMKYLFAVILTLIGLQMLVRSIGGLL